MAEVDRSVGDDETKKKFDKNNTGRLSDIQYRKYRESLLPAQFKVLSSLALEAILTNPQLKQIISDWAMGDEDVNYLISEIENSDFAKEYNTDSARRAWFVEFGSEGDWEQDMLGARGVVQAEATRLGVQLTDQELNGYARAYLYEGWDRNANAMRDALMMGVEKSPWVEQEVTGTLDYAKGVLGDTAASLRDVAYNNGMQYDESWFEEAAKSVASGLTTAEDWERDIRTQAAGYFPAFAEQINAGMNVRALASPYMQRMNRMWDMPVESIGLDDPTLLMAMGGKNENGEFKAMNLADFDNMLREDPRWDNSSNGKNTLLNGINSFLKSGGFKY